MTPEALQALKNADVVAGYKTYLQLIEDLIQDKKVLSSGMKREVDRCQAAIDHALRGRSVALVSSGDAGIYGMAGLVFDLCRERGCKVLRPTPGEKRKQTSIAGTTREEGFTIDVIPGVAAFNASASLLGAPLMHDFASVSLSDLLTPRELIEKRLHAAAAADFVIALYNPRSKSRPHLLDRAREILLRYRPPEAPVGIVGRAMREGQRVLVTTLKDLPAEEVDMQSMVIVGNSQTYVWDGWMVTPRGYLGKYSADGRIREPEESVGRKGASHG